MYIRVDNKNVNIDHIVYYYEGDNKVHIMLTSGSIRLDNVTELEFKAMIDEAMKLTAGIKLPSHNTQIDFSNELTQKKESELLDDAQ